MDVHQRLYSELARITPEEFSNVFGSIESGAFRLELLQQFRVSDEDEPFRQFRSGKTAPPEGYNSGWHRMLSDYVNRGIRFERVRYIVEPPSDYIGFQLNWGYKPNIKAGDKVFLLNDDISMDTLATHVPILKDFWVFDDKECIILEYDITGRYLGASKVPQSVVSYYVNLKRFALDNSSDIQQTALWSRLVAD